MTTEERMRELHDSHAQLRGNWTEKSAVRDFVQKIIEERHKNKVPLSQKHQ